MKKWMIPALALTLCLVLAACGSAQNAAPSTAASAPETTAQTQPADHFQILYDYVLRIGYYQAEEDYYYVQKQDEANGTRYFIAQNGTLRYLHLSSQETEDSRYLYSYECVFYKDKAPEFSYRHESWQLQNGVAVDGFCANAKGSIDAAGEALCLPLTWEECTNCTVESHYTYMNDSQLGCKEIVVEILEESSLPVRYEDLLG